MPCPRPADISDQTCPVCRSPAASAIRLGCGHVCCKECLDNQLRVATTDTDLTIKHFPICCCHEGRRKPILIPVLRQHTTGAKFDALLRASLTSHIRSKPDEYKYCRKPDCLSFEIFTCQSYLTLTCTLCSEELHVGFTCTYQQHTTQNAADPQLLEAYKQSSNTKDCAKCGALIQKTDGCDHMTCSNCLAHICWICIAVFPEANEVYTRIGATHGKGWLYE